MAQQFWSGQGAYLALHAGPALSSAGYHPLPWSPLPAIPPAQFFDEESLNFQERILHKSALSGVCCGACGGVGGGGEWYRATIAFWWAAVTWKRTQIELLRFVVKSGWRGEAKTTIPRVGLGPR